MKKLQLIIIFALFLCAISVSAALSFKIVEDFVNLTGTHDQTLSSSFTVNNTGTDDLAISFTGYTLTSGSNQLSISSLSNISNITNGSSKSATFSVVIPSKQRSGLYTGTLTAASGSLSDTVIIRVNVTPAYSATTNPAAIDLGSASLNSTHTKTFNITNAGNANITNVFFDFSKSGFNLNSNKTNFTLAFNETESIKLNITIPADYSTGNVTLGYVKLVSTELNTKLFDIIASIGGGLEINDLDVFLTTRKGKSGSDLDAYDGRKLNFGDENAGPESEVRFNLNIENTFSDKKDIDINDITVKVTIEELDEGADIEEESAEFDLESNKNEDVDVIIKIPLSVDAGVYDVFVEVQGEDDNGNAHTAQMKLKINVDKEARDVIVSEASLFPDKVKCAGSSTIAVAIKNIGSRMEDNAKLEILNSDLGINFAQKSIKLQEDPFDSDNEFTKKLVITADNNTKAGTYPITVKSYLQEEILWETKTANLVVEACDGQVEEKKEAEPELIKEINKTETVEVIGEKKEETTEGEKIPVLEPATTTEVSFMQRPVFWVLLIALNIIVIGAAAFLVVKLAGKKQ